MSTLGLYFEDKPLRQGTKRALGPADRYPQDQFQKEDELSATFLKHGFSLLNPLVSQPNESSSAKDVFIQKFTEKSEEDETLMPNFYEKRVLKSLKQIQDDSLRCSQIQDDFKNEKKKVSIPKESFRILQPGIAAHQNRHRDLKIFLEDLSDSIPLEDLLNPKKRNTKIPMFLPRKSELFYLFGEHNVPVARATWYIKLIAYNMPLLMPEATSKSTRTKRQNNDPTAEWTKKVVDFFEEMWNKQTDMNLPTQKPQSNNQAKPMSREAIEDYWNYANDLMRYMYTENMLDKEEVLQRLLKICESIKAGEEFKLRQILSTILVYISDFVRNTLHSRRLAFFVSQMIYWIEVEVPEEISQYQSREKSEALVPSSTKEKLNNNPEYERRFDTLTWGLNSIIHLITMYCPSALVWYEPADIRNHPGSPLDILPQAPSQMLIPPSAAQFYNGEQEYLQYLRQHERMISKRSTAVENKWSRYTSKDSLTSAVISKVVDIIRILDKSAQAIRNADPNKADPLKPVYDAIFKLGNIETSSIIGTLCDWAVNSKRYGNFRAILIAKLLAQRQEEIDAQEPGRKTSVPVFQSELFMYLHESAPYSEKTEAFHHLICLFGELIRHDCFSHSMYISSLISRGIRTDITSHSNPGDSRHRILLEHLPIPVSVLYLSRDDDDDTVGERNQREIALYGIGSKRKEVKKNSKKIFNELLKIMLEASEENPLPNYEPIKNLNSCCYFQRFYISSMLVKKISNIMRQYYEGRSEKLPPKEAFSILINILLECGNFIGVMELAANVLPSLRNMEVLIKRKSDSEGHSKQMNTQQKLIKTYTNNVGLIFTGALRLCHDYVLLESDLCSKIFDGFRRLLVGTDPLECFSAERVMLFYIYELYACTKQKESNETWKAMLAKIKIAHDKVAPPTATNFRYSTEIYDDMMKIHLADIYKIKKWCKKNISDGCEKAEENRFSIASAILIAVCSPNTPNARSNELAKLAADVTSIVPTLAQEWLGILQAIMPKTESVSKSYSDVLHRIETGTIRAAEQMAVLYGILIARNVVKLADVLHIIFSALSRTYANGPSADNVREKETRKLQKLCCEFMLFLLRSKPPKDRSSNSSRDMLTQSVDRHLLRACQASLDFQSCLAQALRILMVLSSEAMLSGIPGSQQDQFKIFKLPVDQFKTIDTKSLLDTGKVRDMAEFASKILKAICSEGWVKEKSLLNGDNLVKAIGNLRPEQAHIILQLLCYPENYQEDLEMKEYEGYIEGILKNLDIWTLRQSRLLLLFIFKHTEGHGGFASGRLASTVAKLTTDIIQTSPISRHQKFLITGLAKDIPNVWLLANLIANLPEAVHLKVHSSTTLLLETGIKVGRDTNSNLQLPFLNLILVCIEAHEKERKSLIDKLIEQMQHCVEEYMRDCKTERPQKEEDEKRTVLVQNIQLRLSLIGGMFKTVLQHSTLNCASLLISLIVSGLADEELFEDIYFTCIDMLAVIIHHLAGGDVGLIEPSETRSGSRRDKLHIEKKIKKEIGESDHPQIMGLRQLIPLPRDSLDIVKYEKAPVDKDKSWRTGSLKPVGKEKVSPWDLIEGLKSTFPISLSWFGASRASRLPPHWQYRVRMGECPARSPMEKWLELADLPPDDVQEPAKKEAKTENNILPPQPIDPTKRGIGMGPPYPNMPNASQPQTQAQFNPQFNPQMNNQAMNQQNMQNNMMRRTSMNPMQPMIPSQQNMNTRAALRNVVGNQMQGRVMNMGQYGMPNSSMGRQHQAMGPGRGPMNPYGQQYSQMQMMSNQGMPPRGPQMMNYNPSMSYSRGMGMVRNRMNNPNMMQQNMQMRQNQMRPMNGMNSWPNMGNMRMPNNPMMMQQQQHQMQRSQMQAGQMGMNTQNSMAYNQMGMQNNYQNQGNMMMNPQNAQMNPQSQQQMYQQNQAMNNYG